jgi:hypothetical protein
MFDRRPDDLPAERNAGLETPTHSVWRVLLADGWGGRIAGLRPGFDRNIPVASRATRGAAFSSSRLSQTPAKFRQISPVEFDEACLIEPHLVAIHVVHTGVNELLDGGW